MKTANKPTPSSKASESRVSGRLSGETVILGELPDPVKLPWRYPAKRGHVSTKHVSILF